MTKEELKKRVDEIIAEANDPEAAHGDEDGLMEDLLNEYLPEELLAELRRLWEADFPRWCA